MLLLVYIAIIFFAMGIYMIVCNALKLPALQTSKTVISFYERNKKTYKIDAFLDDLAGKIGRYIKLDEYKRKKMQATLKTAGMNVTPEQYTATIWIKSLVPIMIGIPLYFLFPILFPILLIVGVQTYFKESRTADKKLQQERENIEYELPKLTREISQELKSNRDVLRILERYKNNAGESLKRELEITTADMRSGNYETALTRLETRIQSPMLSDVVRGLISVVRGDDAVVFFQLLAHDFKALEIQRLKNEAAKRPGKIRKYSFLMLGCMLLMYMVIIGISIIRGLGGMF